VPCSLAAAASVGENGSMSPLSRAGGLVPAFALAAIAFLAADDRGAAQAGEEPADTECRVVEFEVTPTDDLQMVVWLEDGAGNYVDTLFITRKTGSYGLGNRPGMMDFNSGPWWPYGRRVTTFPVWAHRHGFSFPLVEFQDGNDDNLSHALGESSRERFYCRPVRYDEDLWDATSCASTVYTDKGVLSGDDTSLYPPRSDITFDPAKDHPTTENMAELNPFDAVSTATPPGGEKYLASWPVPPEVPNGEYVLWLEVSKEFDQNDVYDSCNQPCSAKTGEPGDCCDDCPDCPYPAPPGIPWSEYGVAYRGQPSLVYSTPVSLSDGLVVGTALDYLGYGDPDGDDGEIRPPDATITTGVAGSGAERLEIMVDGGDPYRLRVAAFPSPDETSPDAPGAVTIHEITGTDAQVSFTAPGDDGLEGEVAGYEIRYVTGADIDAGNFYQATEAVVVLDRVAPGELQEVLIKELLPRTAYTVGVRAFDECRNAGPITVFDLETPRPEPGTVDACFIATAAYGSFMANEVSALRAFRDIALRSNLPGEIAVEGYYTFGPLLARTIAPSETLRRAARAALAPLTERVREAGF
jgi:hypothetical protein